MSKLLPEERETVLHMTGDNRDDWFVYSDDPYMMRRLDKLAEVVRIVGSGKEYRIRADQILLRKGKRQVSHAQRQAGASNLKTSSPTKGFATTNPTLDISVERAQG
jgi:hypothetical protein